MSRLSSLYQSLVLFAPNQRRIRRIVRAQRVEVFDDFLSENVGIGEIVGLFEALIPEPDDVEVGLLQ